VSYTILDLPAVLISLLEGSPLFNTAFGDTYNQQTQTGVPKVFCDFADQVPLPYCVITETGESYDYMTAVEGKTNFTSVGKIRFDIYAGNRFQTRTLGFTIAGVLNDAPIYWAGINDEMLFRMESSQFVPTVDPSGPDVPIMFRRVFIFGYEYSSSLPIGSL
jgi:hypothetical protein